MDRGAWWAAVHGGRTESGMIEQLIHTHIQREGFLGAFPEPGVYHRSLFSPQGHAAKPHDLRAGEDTFSSPGQSVPRGTQIAEPEIGGTDRTPTHGEESRGGILPGGVLTEHPPSGGHMWT